MNLLDRQMLLKLFNELVMLILDFFCLFLQHLLKTFNMFGNSFFVVTVQLIENLRLLLEYIVQLSVGNLEVFHSNLILLSDRIDLFTDGLNDIIAKNLPIFKTATHTIDILFKCFDSIKNLITTDSDFTWNHQSIRI